MPPGRVVIARDFERRGDGAEPVENRPGALELVHARPLREIPGDHDGVEARRRRHLERRGHVFSHERMTAVDIRHVQHADGRHARGGLRQGAR
jgi:hypothetical protein